MWISRVVELSAVMNAACPGSNSEAMQPRAYWSVSCPMNPSACSSAIFSNAFSLERETERSASAMAASPKSASRASPLALKRILVGLRLPWMIWRR